jgi:hypothetical protein
MKWFLAVEVPLDRCDVHGGSRTESPGTTRGLRIIKKAAGYNSGRFHPPPVSAEGSALDVLPRHPKVMNRITKRLPVIGGIVATTLVCVVP